MGKICMNFWGYDRDCSLSIHFHSLHACRLSWGAALAVKPNRRWTHGRFCSEKTDLLALLPLAFSIGMWWNVLTGLELQQLHMENKQQPGNGSECLHTGTALWEGERQNREWECIDQQLPFHPQILQLQVSHLCETIKHLNSLSHYHFSFAMDSLIPNLYNGQEKHIPQLHIKQPGSLCSYRPWMSYLATFYFSFHMEQYIFS